MKFLIKSLFLFSFVYLNSSDKLKSIIEKPNESSFKKFRKFFYLTSEEKKEKLELKNFKNDIKNNIFNIVLENKKLNNMEKSFQDNEILKRKKQNNLYLNNISLNINNENQLNAKICDVENQIEDIQNAVKEKENKLDKILDIHNLTQHLAELHIIGQSEKDIKNFENKIRSTIHLLLQTITIAGTIYITIENIKGNK